MPFMIRCKKCNWVYCGQFHSTVLNGISLHNEKSKHKYPDFTITRISEYEFKAYKMLKDKPKFWYILNNRNKPENLKKVSNLFVEDNELGGAKGRF